MKKIAILSFLFCTLCFSQVFKVSNSSEFSKALKQAAKNNQDDTIILNKGIYSTSKGGTFSFVDNEKYNLHIKSAKNLSKNDVILDGDGKDQILNFINTKDSFLEVENITFQNGNSMFRAGIVFSNQRLIIKNCSIQLDNDSTRVASIYSPKKLLLLNTTMKY